MDSCDNAKPLLMLPTELLIKNFIYIYNYIYKSKYFTVTKSSLPRFHSKIIAQ